MADFGAKKMTTEIPRDYPVPSFGMDRDIAASLENLETEEKKLGKWSLDGEDPKANAPTNAAHVIELTKTESIGVKPWKDIPEANAPKK